MSQIAATAAATLTGIQDGAQIAPLKRDEARAMAAEELDRFLALLDTLAGEDWAQPTACTLWSVKDIVAHQAAHVSGFTSLGSFMGQLNPITLNRYLKQGMGMLDAWNQSEVDRRREASPADLIAEIRGARAKSLRGRDRVPALLRAPALPMPGLDQPRSMGYVFDVIYTRDMWMHRADICAATGRTMQQDADYDGRQVALVVRDLAMKARRGLGGRSAVLKLTGTGGGEYRIGASSTPEATLTLDTMDFCVLTSGRATAEAFAREGKVSFSGDADFGRAALNFCENRVLY